MEAPGVVAASPCVLLSDEELVAVFYQIVVLIKVVGPDGDVGRRRVREHELVRAGRLMARAVPVGLVVVVLEL